jgi:hypothetical protein
LAARQNIASGYAVYNISTGKKTTVEEVIAIIKEHLPNLDRVNYLEGTPGDQFGIYGSYTEAQNKLSWVPKVDFCTGFDIMFGWAHDAHTRKVTMDSLLAKKEKVVIFGAGGIGRRLFEIITQSNNVEVVAFVDNDEAKHGSFFRNIPILSPDKLKDIEFDFLHYGTQMGVNEIGSQISNLNVPYYKIKREYIDTICNARKLFVKRFSEELQKQKASGSVAEAGVYRGEFASYLNSVFSTKKLYLFDTFSGFDAKDFPFEQDESLLQAEHFKSTSVDLVINQMTFPEKCVILKGYFPETTKGIDDVFCFVSLDMDLYKPTLEGLEYFYPRMVDGGCILIHDYFTPSYPNVRKAIDDFEQKHGIKLCRTPIGDDVSIAIIKYFS